jgi:hypothetical protein
MDDNTDKPIHNTTTLCLLTDDNDNPNHNTTMSSVRIMDGFVGVVVRQKTQYMVVVVVVVCQ